MIIPNNIIKKQLENVYFIWGRGKTTIANQLNQKYGFYIYSTDESRERQIKLTNPVDQPYMCRDFQKEYGVKSFWELPRQIIAEREKHFLEEMTPMMIAELIKLSSLHKIIICEGDIDYYAVSSIATHTVHLCNCSTSFDWFSRPDHENIRQSVEKRTDLDEAEKQSIIENAYKAVSGNEGIIPDWVIDLNIKNIAWDENKSIEVTAKEVATYFGFNAYDTL